MHERIKHRGGVWALLAVMVLAVMAFAFTFTSPREASAAGTNLLQGKEVTASAQYDTMSASNLVDGKDDTRWSTEANAPQWAYVDMGSEQTVGSFRVLWEKDSVYASAYKVYVSNSTDDWGTAVYSTTENSTQENEVTLDTPASGRYIKLEVTAQHGYPSVSAYEFQAFAPESTEPAELVNLAQGKNAVASNVEAGTSYTADKAFDGITEGKDSHWGTDKSDSIEPRWIYVDLGSVKKVHQVNLYWERANIKAYKIQVSTAEEAPATEDGWTTVYEKTGNDFNQTTEEIALDDAPVEARFVRVYVSDYAGNGTGETDMNWPNVGFYEIQVMGEGDGTEPEQDPQENVARGKTAAADSSEAGTLGADKAVDGDTTSKSSRWASAVDATENADGGPHWIYVDLGAEYDVKNIRIYWEMRKANGYHVDIATGNAAPAADSEDWKTVYTNDGRPSSKTETIKLETVQKARFVRLYIDHNTYEDPDGGTAWGNISIYELEVYGGEPPMSPAELADQIVITPPKQGDDKLKVSLPEVEGYTVEYRGTDYEQIVDSEYNINAPLVNKDVKLAFKITDTKTGNYEFAEKTVTIPGALGETNQGNEAPTILPELSEWYGGESTFTLNESTQIIYTTEALKEVVDLFASDLSAVTGMEFTAKLGAAGSDNAIVFTQDDSNEMIALGEEGYKLSVTGTRVTVTASNNGAEWDGTTSANWGAQTLLQAFEQGNGSIAQGEARDYPLYSVRGLILDVGRKTFTMESLYKLCRQMTYYKMNDLNIHLNDNYIPIEQYVADGIDPADPEKGAYSGFRMESDVKAGETYEFAGVEHTAQADLTSTDLYYTKAEFKEFVRYFGVLGMNISPEIDLPAHSLAITKVFNDLSYGVMRHRNRDHLDILNRYDEVLSLAEMLWGEYTGEGGAFSDAKYINIGADEFNVSGTGDHAVNGENLQSTGTAYRRFVNDLTNYILENTDATPRVWGSLSNYSGDNSIVTSAKNAQVLLWNTGYANMKEMYNLGYELIYCDDGQYYIVPGATYYYDYLNAGTMYNGAVNTQGSVTIPAGDPQMVGGMYAAWNDMIDRQDIGMSEFDIYDRIYQSMGLYGAKTWGKPAGAMSLEEAQGVMADLGTAPNASQGYEQTANEDGTYVQLGLDDQNDASGMERGVTELKNATVEDLEYTSALKLNGGESYAKLENIETLGLGSDLRVKVMRTSASAEDQVLFESEYGQIKAVQGDTGKVGISREGYDFSFDYTLPVGEWVELEFKNVQNTTALFVNGELVGTIGTGTRGQVHATNMFPLAYVGSATDAFEGYVNDIYVTTSNTDSVSTTAFNSTMDLYTQIQIAYSIDEADRPDNFDEAMAAAKAVINKINPTDDEINTALAPVKEIVDNAGFDPADYTLVDKYLEYVNNLDKTAYTDESIAALDKVVESIDRTLLAPQQSVVDGYAAALEEAISGLEVVESVSLDFINNALLTATACSEQSTTGNEGPASNVLDGDPSTMWHTTWAGDSHDGNHWIQLSTKDGETMTVAGFEYTPRTSGSNGLITGYQIQVQKIADGAWETVAEGSWANNNQVKTVEFNAVECVAVRLVATESQHDGNITFGSAAEIRLVNGNTTADTKGLKALVDVFNEMNEDDFTPETWAEYAKAIETAKALLEGAPDSESVEQAKIAINKAYAQLRFAEASEPEPVKPDTSKLQAAIAAAESLKADGYTTESWAKVEAALADAKAALGSNDQKVVDAAAKALTDAIEALVEVEPSEPGTDEPGTDGPGDATDPDDQKPGDTTKPGGTTTGGSTTGGSTSGGNLAQTSDPTSMVAALATALAGAGALVASRKRR